MFRLGKLLFGLAVAGVTAATVYSYLDESSKAAEDDFDEDLDDIDEDGGDEEEEEDPAERFITAANRTYTTIKASSADAMAKVREAIGPKGEEVLDVVNETAGKVKTVVADSAARVKDILAEEESDLDEKVVEEAVANAVAKEMEEEDAAREVYVDWESEASEEIHEDDDAKEAIYEGEENGEAIHEDDHDKEAVYEEEHPEEAE
jgi:hypothetical protein